MKQTIRRTAQRVSSWLDTKSEFGTSLMAESGSVTRREVLLTNAIGLVLVAGAIMANDSILMALLCIVIAAVLVRKLNIIANNYEHGK